MRPRKPAKNNPMPGKERPEVAGLGRPETPAEKNERVRAARAERKARQNMRNLVWSLLASLGVVALLVIVVVRPDDSLRDAVQWEVVAEQAAPGLPGEPVVPRLSELWESNRAEVRKEPGSEATWSIGFLGPEQSYVFVDQGFGADDLWVIRRTENSRSTGVVQLGWDSSFEVEWEEYDRQQTDPGGNRAYVVVTAWEDSIIVVGGTTEQAVREVANDISHQLAMRENR